MLFRSLIALAVLSIVGLACGPVRRVVLDHAGGVPARGACTPHVQRCTQAGGVFLPVVCSDDHREWPALPLRPDGTQRTCAPGEGCTVSDAGVAHCTAAVDGGAP